jgi:PAS domain S-box-containing protein
MKRKPKPLIAATPLRRRAEVMLRKQAGEKKSGTGQDRSPADTPRLLHELQVHQIELEMQNEELRTARDEMEAGMEKYSELYDFAPVGYLTLDPEGAIREANLTAASLLGVSRAPLMKRRLGIFVAPADLLPFNAFLRRVFANRDWQECDVQLLVKDKKPVDVRMRGNLAESGQSCRVAMTDITEHKRAEEKVRVSEIRFRRLFETAHDGILLLDPGTRKITDANPLMTKMLGYPRNQLVGKELFEIGLLKDEAASQAMFQKLTRKHEVRYEDLPLESQGGRHQEVEVVANLYVENGHAVIQCNIRDITARKQIEHVLAGTRALLAGYTAKLEKLVAQRTTELTATNQQLGIALTSTRLGEEQNRVLLLESQDMQKKLRRLTHQILTAQEEERKKISRELHDEVVQTLVGINVELSALVYGNSPDIHHLKDKIARTQRLVEKSVDAVHRFARDLRPAVLDDLGLIPALHAFCLSLAERKKLKIKMTAFGGVEAMDGDRRTVLFRVAQEALTNVARHARATRVRLSIKQISGAIRMEIADNGMSFPVKQLLQAKNNKRLGLVGMKERIEMVGGNLIIESVSGKGTTVRAEIPFTLEKT